MSERLVSIGRRIPFTLALEVAIVLLALLNGSAAGTLGASIARDWGFGPLYFWRGHWHSLATGAFLVRNTAMLAGIVLFLAVSVGVYERRLGTRRALLLFVLTHVSALFLTAALVVLPLHLAGAPVQGDWAPAGDVGASFGGFGCLGGWIGRLDPTRRARWIVLVTLALAAKLLVLPERFGDMGHLIAFYSGMALDRVLPRPRGTRPTGETRS